MLLSVFALPDNMIMNVLQLRSGGAEIFGSDLTLGEKVALKSQNFAVQASACLAICQPDALPLLQQACFMFRLSHSCLFVSKNTNEHDASFTGVHLARLPCGNGH